MDELNDFLEFLETEQKRAQRVLRSYENPDARQENQYDALCMLIGLVKRWRDIKEIKMMDKVSA